MVSGRISRDRARPQGTGPIAIDARAAIRPEFGGVERWARELSARLPALRPGAYAVLAPPGRLAHRAGHAWEQVVLPARAARLGARALLCPANLAPIAYGRSAVVIHDAAVLRHPGWYSRAYAAWQRVALPAIARRARRVMTVSEFSRRELNDLLGVDADVVPGGVDERFGPHADTAPARRACGLDGPYVLCVASHTARKNLGALVPAARALAAEGIRVAVAGGHRPQFAREPGLADLRLLGHVDDALLPGLYAGAESFALPSRYEGFGLTVLEAMACGTPVVAADAGALPETCGGAALRGHLRRVARGRRLRRRPRPLGHGGPVRRPRAAHVVPAGGRPRRRAPSAPCSRCTRTRSSRSTCAGTTS